MSDSEDFMYEDESDFGLSEQHDNDDFDDDYADDDLGFDAVVAEKDKKKPYEVDYQVISLEELRAANRQEVAHVAGILSISTEHSLLLLKAFRWNKERLIEKYMENSEQVLQQAGVDASQKNFPESITMTNFMCEICCTEEPKLKTISLSCGHRYCTNCYSYYLKQKIVEEGEGRSLRCPGMTCKLNLDDRTLKLLVGNEVYAK
jgi:ariadne-1